MHGCRFFLILLLVSYGWTQDGQRRRSQRNATQTSVDPAVHPGELPSDVNPDQLQFMLDLGGDGNDPQMPLDMEAATQFAIEKHSSLQKNGFVAAGLAVLEVPPKTQRPAARRGRYNASQRETISRLQAEEAREQNRRLRMLATGHHVVKHLNSQTEETILEQFEGYHWNFLKEAVPQLLDEWPYKGLLSWERPNWTYLEQYGLEEKAYFKQPTRQRTSERRRARSVLVPASYRNQEGLAILVAGMFFGEFLSEEHLLPNVNGEDEARSAISAWEVSSLPKLLEQVGAVNDWLTFTGENQVIREVDANGDPVFFVLEDGEKKSLNTAIDKGAVGPVLKSLVQRNGLQGWLKFVGSSKFGPRIVQFALQTTELGRAIADTAVHMLEQLLRDRNRDLVVQPEFLNHHFAKTLNDFAERFDLQRFQNYGADSEERIRRTSELDRAGVSKASGMNLMGKALARGFAIEGAVDIAFRLGSAAYGGLGDDAQIGDETYTSGGRDRIQLSGDPERDRRRQTAYAVEDAWDDWKRNGIQNTAGYVAGGLATAVATPFVFGVAAAAGAPTAGAGSVAVMVAGYAVVGATAYGATQGARAALEGVDDRLNHLRLNDRLTGIWLDMAVNSRGEIQDSDALVGDIVQAATVRYQDNQNMKYMALVDSFENVELKKEEGLTQFRLEQQYGNFLDSRRVDSWENWLKDRAMAVGTLGISAAVSAFSEWYQGEEATVEEREARILYDFYDLAGNQAQWDDYPDAIVPVGPIHERGVVFVGTREDQIDLSSPGVIRGTEDNSDLRILSNGLILARSEQNRERWVLKGHCEQFDVFVREEVGQGSGRYSCLNNTLRYVEELNRIQPSVGAAPAPAPVSGAEGSVPSAAVESGVLDQSMELPGS